MFKVIVLGFLLFFNLALASNFEKVGEEKEAIKGAELVLKERVETIEKLITQIVVDGIAPGKEMRQLIKEVKDFKKTKKAFDKELKAVYGIKTEANLDEGLLRALKSYVGVPRRAFCRDSERSFKLYFVTKTGKNVKIGIVVYFPALILPVIVTLASLALLLCVATNVSNVFDDSDTRVLGILFGIGFLIAGLAMFLT